MSPMLEETWAHLVPSVVQAIDEEWRADSHPLAWPKADGSQVSSLDLRLDSAIRACVTERAGDWPLLSEESGLWRPASSAVRPLAVIDPVDGTESLIAGADSWWVSLGILLEGRPVAGMLYQPTTGRLHDSALPGDVVPTRSRAVGLSPDLLEGDEARRLRGAFELSGFELARAPHAAEKVAAVLEGRVAAAVYVPTTKSPAWHIWDLTAAIAIATANGLRISGLDGEPIMLDPHHVRRVDSWICARDDQAWLRARETVISSMREQQ